MYKTTLIVYDLKTQNLNFVAPVPKQIGTTTMHFPEVPGKIKVVKVFKNKRKNASYVSILFLKPTFCVFFKNIFNKTQICVFIKTHKSVYYLLRNMCFLFKHFNFSV